MPVDKTKSSRKDSSQQKSLLLLRQRAEEYLREKEIRLPEVRDALSVTDAQRVISELQILQIELELQNEELRRTQMELVRARQRYFNFYDKAPVAYCTVSEKGLILKTNLTVGKLLGIDPEALLNQPFSRFIASEDQDNFYLLCKQLLESGELQSDELRLLRQDRTCFWVNLEAAVEFNERGTTAICVMLSDISKRKQAEEALKKTCYQNQVILESITDAFISLSDEMVVYYFNAAAEKMFNRQQSEVVGRRMFDVLPEGKGSIFEDNCLQVIRTKSPRAFETELIVVSCQNWYGVRVYPSTEGITIYLQVITDRKKTEEGKVKLGKAESLERMAGAITHLFNNHLQVALGNLEVALNSLAADAVQREYVLNAIQANHRSSEVSGLLLTYLGQKVGKLKPLDLSTICRETLIGIDEAAPSRVNIETNIMSSGPYVRANASQLQQILTILLTNAREAIGDHTGRVTVGTKSLPASALPISHIAHSEWEASSLMFACLEVSDTGCGMSNEEMDKIFDPFYTTKFTGRGLGLAVAMSLIKAWGGSIQAKSEVQNGSCFTVFLPLVTDDIPRQAESPAVKRTIKAKGTILLVDDDPLIHEVIKAVLEHLGFTVFVATNGREAVALFEKHQNSINCLLTDLSMRGMDGWEIISAMRKIKPDLSVILSSGYDEAYVMGGDQQEIPQAFLHKPYTKDDLENVLNRVLPDAA